MKKSKVSSKPLIAPRHVRTRLVRHPERGSFDRTVINGILDESLFCHVGFILGGQPYVIPTIHARIANELYIHGSAASRMLRIVSEGGSVCVTVSLLDGLILARSAFNHSMNYRSVVILGKAKEVTDEIEKRGVLNAFVERMMPGRWSDIRPPNNQELKATKVLRIPIEEVSAKIRTGPPVDDAADYDLRCWAGEIPLAIVRNAPIPDPRLDNAIELPIYIRNYLKT